MSSENALGWYEANLPSIERKQRGHFSTPPRLVEYILDACGYTPTTDLSRIRVLDPACGSGNFLAGAARRLATSMLQTEMRQATQWEQTTQDVKPEYRRKILQ